MNKISCLRCKRPFPRQELLWKRNPKGHREFLAMKPICKDCAKKRFPAGPESENFPYNLRSYRISLIFGGSTLSILLLFIVLMLIRSFTTPIPYYEDITLQMTLWRINQVLYIVLTIVFLYLDLIIFNTIRKYGF